jgi:hypothetical protein
MELATVPTPPQKDSYPQVYVLVPAQTHLRVRAYLEAVAVAFPAQVLQISGL